MLIGMVFNTYSSVLLDNGSWQIKTFRRERDHEEKGVYVDLRLDIQVLCDGHPSKRSLFQEQLATI